MVRLISPPAAASKPSVYTKINVNYSRRVLDRLSVTATSLILKAVSRRSDQTLFKSIAETRLRYFFFLFLDLLRRDGDRNVHDSVNEHRDEYRSKFLCYELQ